MADITYTVNQDSPENIAGFEQYSQQDKNLVGSFQINSVFDANKHLAELHILSLSDELLESDYNYTSHTQLGNAQSSGQEGASILTIDPIADSKAYGYENGGVKLLYHFLNDLYTKDKSTQEFFIQSISPDRLEVALSTLNLTPEEVVSYTSDIKNKVAGLSYFAGFRLNFKNSDLVISTNIDTLDLQGHKVVVVKLYEPLPSTYDLKSTLSIVEEVSDSVAYEVDSQIILQPESLPTLRSANFNIEVADESIIPTQYFDYTDLLSYPVSNDTNQIFSAINEKSIDVNVDYSNFADFVHFSSAQERLLNFKYKLDLVNSYYSNLNAISGSTTGLQAVSGSAKYYQGLITGIVGNFDHYERFLYYESGSTSWPKSDTTKPYVNKASNTSEAVLWFTNQVSNALAFDQTNNSSLVYSIPAYLSEDSNNQNYLTFVYMIGQHFDNLWLYAKAVTDKYDADNRPNFGISRDLVAEALKNFGVKLYTSNKSIEDLFTTFIGQAYQSGSEKINHYITGSLTGSNTPIQPTSYDSYQKEVQKRIYHNLPLLLKSKGTERGVRALINCFGISSDILPIKLYGGENQTNLPFFGDQQYVTSSLDKIRLDNTGSITDGNTLSGLTSIINRDDKYTDDLHTIEVGFSPTDNIDRYIISQSAGTFTVDDFLGDARNLTSSSYSGLYNQAYSILGNLDTYDLQDYVRLIKFFDNTVFKMIKDFVPARSVDVTGIIIKPNLLNISKAKSVAVSATQPEYEGTIDTAFISASHGSSFLQSTGESNTAWISSVQTPFGLGIKTDHLQQEAKFNGEFSSSYFTLSTGELNTANSLKIQTPIGTTEQVGFYINAPTGVCGLSTLGSLVINNSNYISHSMQADLMSFFTTGVTYEVHPSSFTVGIDGTATFPKLNYTSYSVTASKSGSAPICSSSILYNIAYCDLATYSAPSTVVKDSVVDLTTWFTTGSNTQTSYTASWTGNTNIGIPNSGSYTFSQAGGTSVQIIVKDSIIGGCQTTNTVTVTYTPPPTPTITFTSYSSLSVSPFGGTADIKTATGTFTIANGSFIIGARSTIYTNNNTTVYTLLTLPSTTLTAQQSDATGYHDATNPITLGPGTYAYNLYVRGSGTGGSGQGEITVTSV